MHDVDDRGFREAGGRRVGAAPAIGACAGSRRRSQTKETLNPQPVRVGMTDWNLGQRGDIDEDRAGARDRPRRHPGQRAVPDRRQDADAARSRRRRPRSSAPRSRTASRSARWRSAIPASRGCRCTPIAAFGSCWSRRWRLPTTSAPTTSCCRFSATATST